MSNSKLGKWLDENAFRGLGPSSWRKHYSLFPMYACIVVGLTWCAIFSTRTFIFNPDSTFLGPHAYERYRDKEFLFFNFSGVRPKCKAPIYRREGDPDDESYVLPEGKEYRHGLKTLFFKK